MKPVGIGVVGTGRWGKRYLETLRTIPEASVVGVHDADLSVCRAVAGRFDVPACPTLDSLLSLESLDAVVVATPDRTHAELAARCLTAGRHVLVEKPMAADTASAVALDRLAQSRALALTVGHTMLYDPEFARMATTVGQGRIGRPTAVSAVWTSRGPDSLPEGNGSASAVLWDLGPHVIAMLVSLLGPPLLNRTLRSGDTRAVLELMFLDETKARCELAWTPAEPSRRIRIAGTDAELSWHQAPGLAPAPADRPLTRLCQDFIACCANDSTPLSNGRLGIEVTRCLEVLAGSTPEPHPCGSEATSTSQK